MNHTNQCAVRRGDKVDLRINLGKLLFQNDHGEHAGSRRDISRPDCHAVGCSHSGSRITLGRTQGNSGFQLSAGIKKSRSLFRENTGSLASRQNLWHNLPKLPGKALAAYQLIEFVNHGLIQIAGLDINGEHSGSVSHSENLLPCQLIVDISCQSGDEGNVLHMLFLVQDRLIQVRNAPSLRNIVVEFRRQSGCGFLRDGISPCPEGNEEIIILIKGKIAMHHGGKSDGTDLCDLRIILLFHIPYQILITLAKTLPHIRKVIGPDSVYQLVFPFIASGCQRRPCLVNQHCLDPGRAKLNTKNCLPLHNYLFCFHTIPPFILDLSVK